MTAAEGELDLSDLEATPALTSDQQAQLDAMQRDFKRVTAVVGKLTPERAAEAWRRFLRTYGADIPGTAVDDGLRTQATTALGLAPAAGPPAVVAPPPEPVVASAPAVQAVVPRLQAQTEAYRAAKRLDLSNAATSAKLAAWREFLAANADDVPGTMVDDEQRQRATARLNRLRSTTSAGDIP